jgi:hypothetical protein
MASSYQQFCEALAYIQQDQEKFENLAGSGEFSGPKHEELAVLGSKMLRNLLKLAKKGESFAQSLPPDFLERLTHACKEYYLLFMPPKRFGGLCPCLKLRRYGIEYEKRLCVVKAEVVSAVFLPIGAIVDSKAEVLNIDSVKYSEYIARMNDLFKLLQNVITKGNETVREKARKDLLMAWDSVGKFLEHYCESNESFLMEAKRQLRSVKETLTNLPKPAQQQASSDNSGATSSAKPTTLGRRLLVKAQSGLQEIMNSAALIVLNISKTSLYAVDDIQKILRRERDAEVAHFNGLEDEMHDEESIHILHRLREESEIVYNDANNKLREAAKRWNTVKGQAKPRPVAVIEEPPPPQSANPNIFPPGQAIANTSKEIGNLGKNAAKEGGKIAKEAVTGVKDIVTFVTGDVVKGVGNIATSGAKTALHAGQKAASLPVKAAKAAKGQFDAMIEDDQPDTPQSASKLSGGGFPAFDFPKINL